MDKILKATPLDNYKIEILTSSGVSGVFDVKPYLQGSAFKELVDESYTKHYALLLRCVVAPLREPKKSPPGCGNQAELSRKQKVRFHATTQRKK